MNQMVIILLSIVGPTVAAAAEFKTVETFECQSTDGKRHVIVIEQDANSRNIARIRGTAVREQAVTFSISADGGCAKGQSGEIEFMLEVDKIFARRPGVIEQKNYVGQITLKGTTPLRVSCVRRLVKIVTGFIIK